MKTPILTILTPTYNRKHLLVRLYASLAAQKVPSDSFEWLVVDDGSTDGTISYIQEITLVAPFSIRIIAQENGGKHRALNTGVREVQSPWLLIVDSDDWLLPDGIKNSCKEIQIYDERLDIKAIMAPLKFPEKEPKLYSVTGQMIKYKDWREKHLDGDFSMLVRSTTMLKNSFPEFPGENFIAEGVVYSVAFRDGGILLSNSVIMGAEYQVDGLSSRARALRARCALGSMQTYTNQLLGGLTGQDAMRANINLCRYFIHCLLTKKSPKEFGLKPNLLYMPLGLIFVLADLVAFSKKNRKSVS